MRIDDEAWRRLLLDQDGVVSRAQALGCGWTATALRHRVVGGRWQLLVPGVLLTTSGAPTQRQRLHGALVHAGPSSALAAATACRWHGLSCAGDEESVHVAVPAEVRRTSRGFVAVHPTIRPLWSYSLDGLQVVPIARAVVDAAQSMTSANDVRALCAQAVQQRRTDVEALVVELEAGPSAGSALVRRVLAEVRDGARSAPEAVLLRALRRCRGLPSYRLNVDVHAPDGTWLAKPDVVFASVRVIVEVDGWKWHQDPARQRADLERHTRLEAAGWTVLRYAAAAVLADPDGVAKQVARVVAAKTR